MFLPDLAHWVAAPYQTTRDLIDLYSANGTRSLITNVTIDEFIAKSFKLNPDYASYANLLMISLQQGSICQTRPFLPKMDAEDNMEEEIMIKEILMQQLLKESVL